MCISDHIGGADRVLNGASSRHFYLKSIPDQRIKRSFLGTLG